MQRRTCSQYPQWRPVVLRHVRIPRLQQEPDRSGWAIELVDLQPLYHVPITTRVGVGGVALKQDGGRAISQRTVDDVRVAGDPADVGNTTVHVAWLVVKHVLQQKCSTVTVNFRRAIWTPSCKLVDRGQGPRRGRGWWLKPPNFGQLDPYLWFSLRTYPSQKTKRSQERDVFKISNAFPARKPVNPTTSMHTYTMSWPVFDGSWSILAIE